MLRWLRQHEQQPRRLLFVSSTGVYAQRDGEWIDEDSPTEPTGFTGQVMLEAEQLPSAAACRPPACAWAGCTTRVALAAEPVRAGLRVERDPPQYSNRIHRDDAAALLAFLLQADASGTALQPCYTGSTTSRRRCTRWSTGCASGWVSPTGPSRA